MQSQKQTLKGSGQKSQDRNPQKQNLGAHSLRSTREKLGIPEEGNQVVYIQKNSNKGCLSSLRERDLLRSTKTKYLLL